MDINTTSNLKDSPDLVIWFTDAMKEAPADSAQVVMSVWFRDLTGADDQAINDAVLLGGTRGNPSPGAGIRALLIRSVAKITARAGDDHVSINGVKIDGPMTGEIHDVLPRWAIKRMNEHSEGSDPEEELG